MPASHQFSRDQALVNNQIVYQVASERLVDFEVFIREVLGYL